ncbi:thioesterase II family protein [Robbsia andropogonis]|uniref:thioesterase II family protein n=1 Tax=Robbsia andropogonis TaxID=28092 RepID=UPI0004646B6B|nr:thioesterase domain-containing protein [Robbsia andropogonis]MCP1120885.1 thioesterase domain-containing protein [Robbsia andropogonis]MCP1130653.1 thioesterase domain-containing protein [Robbsia andropogonis]
MRAAQTMVCHVSTFFDVSHSNFLPVTNMDNKWIKYFRNNGSGLTLFCFPYSGAGPSAFRDWEKALSPSVDIAAIQLPGREGRITEPPFTRFAQLIPALGEAIRPQLNGSFMFFGHSLGGLVCYELSCWLIAQGLPVPRHLFISAIRAPHCSRRARTLHDLPDAELVDELRRLNGTPKAILDNPALLGFFLPALRADLALSETYVHHATAPLDIPITVFSGQRDPYVDADEISAWHGHTEHAFSWHRMDGDHFYINTPARTVLFETLQRTIAAMLSIERTEA